MLRQDGILSGMMYTLLLYDDGRLTTLLEENSLA